MNLKVLIEPDEGGWYSAHVPSLPGCVSQGKSVDEALKNIKEAIQLYLEPLDKEEAKSPEAQVYEVIV